jgi:hypothetical protein
MTTQTANLNCSMGIFEAIASKIERDPSLLRIPLENIERWLANNHTAPHRLRQWRDLILHARKSPDRLAGLLQLLRAQDEESLHLKSFDPFAGVLTSKERQSIILQCAYAH